MTVVLVVTDRVFGGNGTAGSAATAGNAAAMPALVAAANPVYAPAAAQATVLVRAYVIVSSLSVPILTAWWTGHVQPHAPAG